MEGLDRSGNKNSSEDTVEFNTLEYLKGLACAEGEDRPTPLNLLAGARAAARRHEDKDEYWGAILAYRRAIELLPKTDIPVEEAEAMASRFSSRIDLYQLALANNREPWPGEPEPVPPPQTPESPQLPKSLSWIALRLGPVVLRH